MRLYPWYIVIVLNLSHAMAILDRYLVGLVVEPMKAQLLLTDTQIGILQGPAFLVFYCLMSLPIGLLVDTVSRRTMLAAAICLWSLATAAVSVSDTFPELLLARSIVGLGEACILPAALSLISAYFPPDKLGRANGVYAFGGSEGKTLAFAGGGAVYALLVSAERGGPAIAGMAPWQELFLLASLPGLVLAVLIMLTVREPPRHSPPQPKWQVMREAFAYVRSHPATYLGILVCLTAISAMGIILAGWVVAYFGRVHNVPVASAGGLVGLVSIVASAIGVGAGSVMTDKLQLTRIGVISPLLIAAAAMSLMGLSGLSFTGFQHSLAGALIGYSAVQLFLVAGLPSSYAAIQLATPAAYRGSVTAGLAVVYVLAGGALGPILVGLMSDHVFTGPHAIANSLSVATAAFGMLAGSVALLTTPHLRRTCLALRAASGA